MSVILATPDGYDGLRGTIGRLRTQRGVERMELVIVAPSADAVNIREQEVKDFFG